MQSEVRAISRDITFRGPEEEAAVLSSMAGAERELQVRAEMTAKLAEKQREIEKLHAALEAVAPIPGFDVDMYKRLVLAQGEHDVDYRDKKIVDLAKKCRNLTVQLTKYQTETESLKEALYESNQMCSKLKEEVAIAGARKSKIPMRSTVSGPSSDPEVLVEQQQDTIRSLQKELKEATRSTDELKLKLHTATEEAKSLRGALARELGEGVSVDQALDGNWRGRAQQIVMLKAKVS